MAAINIEFQALYYTYSENEDGHMAAMVEENPCPYHTVAWLSMLMCSRSSSVEAGQHSRESHI